MNNQEQESYRYRGYLATDSEMKKLKDVTGKTSIGEATREAVLRMLKGA